MGLKENNYNSSHLLRDEEEEEDSEIHCVAWFTIHSDESDTNICVLRTSALWKQQSLRTHGGWQRSSRACRVEPPGGDLCTAGWAKMPGGRGFAWSGCESGQTVALKFLGEIIKLCQSLDLLLSSPLRPRSAAPALPHLYVQTNLI